MVIASIKRINFEKSLCRVESENISSEKVKVKDKAN